MAHDNVLLLIDGKGQIIEWEHAAEKRFGCSASEAVGQPAKALFHSLSRDDIQLPARGQSGGFKIKPALQDHCLVWRVIAAEGDLMADMTILETLFPRSSVEVQVFDDQLHVGCTSTLAGERPQVRHPRGAPFSAVCGFAAPEEEAAVARGVLASGIPVENRLVHGAETSAEFGRLVHSISYLPLEDASGAVHGLVMVSVDVTARERERRAQALLEDVRVQMGHRPGLMDVCQEFVQAVAPAFADTAVVELVESAVRGEDVPRAPLGPGALLRQAAIQGHRPATQAGVVHPLPDGTPFSRVFTDLQSRLVPISAASTWLNGDPSRADIIEKSTAHSLIVSPLVIGHEILGMVSFYRHGADDPFVQDDLAVATAICTHAALCIDRARLAMREWIIMSTVQRKILPGELTDQAFVQLASLHHQGEEGGGAWADAIALPGARTALVVGDVAGKGIPAAVTMGLLRTAIHTLAALDLQPDELLARLGDTTARLVAARAALPPMDPLIHEPLTVSCSIAIYDPVTGACTIARAGLPDPVVIFPDGVTLALSVPPGPALAARDTAPFPAVTVFLAGGSTLVMGTPALAEEVLSPAGALRPLLDDACHHPLPRLRDTIEKAHTQRDHTDEALLLFARTRTLPGDQVMTLPLPAGSEAAPLARKAVRRQLEVWGLDDETAVTNELIVSELVGNATRYGAPPLQLRLILDRMLTCEVSDASPSAPRVTHARTVDESGRGLFIISSVAEQWGTRYTADGKIVWAEQLTEAKETA